MNTLRIILLTASLVLMTTLLGGVAFARTLNGELVVMDASGHRFRVVGYDGSYVAPAGTPLEALDGRPVQVEVASNGQVQTITEVSVPINPISHGFSQARGTLEVRDELNGTFTLAGDSQYYTAPANINIANYANRMVQVDMDENGRVTAINLVGPAPVPLTSLPLNPAPVPVTSLPLRAEPLAMGCAYGGQTYSDGSAVCQSGMQFRCDGSRWSSLGAACGASEARVLNSDYGSLRSCAVGDATVANGSSVCRRGTTYRCDDGEWFNVGTACR